MRSRRATATLAVVRSKQMEYGMGRGPVSIHTPCIPSKSTMAHRVLSFSVSPRINLPQGKISPPQGNAIFWLLLFVLLQKIYEKITPGYNKHSKGRDWWAKEEAGLGEKNTHKKNSGSENTGTTYLNGQFINVVKLRWGNYRVAYREFHLQHRCQIGKSLKWLPMTTINFT